MYVQEQSIFCLCSQFIAMHFCISLPPIQMRKRRKKKQFLLEISYFTIWYAFNGIWIAEKKIVGEDVDGVLNGLLGNDENDSTISLVLSFSN